MIVSPVLARTPAPNGGEQGRITRARRIPPRYAPRVRVAVIQMSSTDDVDANLKRARGWIDDAAAAGAELIALPENFAYMRHEGDPIA